MPIILTGTPSTVTARAIITDALTFGLNALAPGETLDADLAETCLSALNNAVDEINGGQSVLWREIFTVSGAITGEYGTLGVHWSSLSGGEPIRGASVQLSATEERDLYAITMAQYHSIQDKGTTGTPEVYAYDGMATVFLYPAVSGAVVTLRTLQVASEFDDLDTEHAMPRGYRSALAALLAERMAPSLGMAAPWITQQANAARLRLMAQNIRPAIINAGLGRPARIEQDV